MASLLGIPEDDKERVPAGCVGLGTSFKASQTEVLAGGGGQIGKRSKHQWLCDGLLVELKTWRVSDQVAFVLVIFQFLS